MLFCSNFYSVLWTFNRVPWTKRQYLLFFTTLYLFAFNLTSSLDTPRSLTIPNLIHLPFCLIVIHCLYQCTFTFCFLPQHFQSLILANTYTLQTFRQTPTKNEHYYCYWACLGSTDCYNALKCIRLILFHLSLYYISYTFNNKSALVSNRTKVGNVPYQ